MKKLVGIKKLQENEERLTKFWKTLLMVFTVMGILLAINQVFSLGIFGFRPKISAYLYY